MELLNIYDGKGSPVVINVRTFELRLFRNNVGWLTVIDVAPTNSQPSTNLPFNLKFSNNNFVHFTNNDFDDVVLSEDPPQFEGEFEYFSHSIIELTLQINLSDFYPQINKEEVSNGLPTNL